MKDKTPRVLRFVFFGFVLLAVLIVLGINRNLAALAEWIYPGSALWAHAGLVLVEALAFVWFWRGLFGGRKRLLLVDDTPEGRADFAKEFARRMRSNSIIREAGLAGRPGTTPDGRPDEEYFEQCLKLLNARADMEIRQTARRIFLATSLSQNGRLDALIVFVSLCRLIWRVSSVYNQRPHPREISSLYWAVASSTFLALSLEELDITTEITVGFGEAFHAMAPAGITASLPFAGKALQVFTSSTIDGAANCYLTLRAGIIARNAYVYAAKQKERPSRAAVFREAGEALLDMSQDLVQHLAGALAGNLAGAVRKAGRKTLRASKDMMGYVCSGVPGFREKEPVAAGQAGSGTTQSREPARPDALSVEATPVADRPERDASAGKARSTGFLAITMSKRAVTGWHLLRLPLRPFTNRGRPASPGSDKENSST